MQVITERIIRAEETIDGSGVRIKRLFPTQKIKNYDPFVLLDEFFLEPSAGFPRHRHRGFEAITFMLEGGFHHTDTLGNDNTVLADAAQYFVAGRGIEHTEMPGTDTLNHGIQLWINLPLRLKKTKPAYRQFAPDDFPIVREGGQGESTDILERTIAGQGSPLKPHSNILFRDLMLRSGASYVADMPANMQGLLYCIDGNLRIEDENVPAGAAYLLDMPTTEVSAATHAHCIFLAGEPHHEPIHQHGSIVD